MKNKIQQKIYAIFQTLKTYASKLRISSFVGGQFKKRQTLTNKIKKMILRFVNKIQDKVLTTYHITIDFKTLEKKPTFYRLELLAELRSDLELGYLKTNIFSIVIGKKFDLTNISTKEVKTQYEKKRIEEDFNDKHKKSVAMNFLFRHWTTDQYGKLHYVNDTTVEKTAKKDYRVNILKSGEIPFGQYEDMFCIEIDTTDFKGEDK
jgi:hypothetical protein